MSHQSPVTRIREQATGNRQRATGDGDAGRRGRRPLRAQGGLTPGRRSPLRRVTSHQAPGGAPIANPPLLRGADGGHKTGSRRRTDRFSSPAACFPVSLLLVGSGHGRCGQRPLRAKSLSTFNFKLSTCLLSGRGLVATGRWDGGLGSGRPTQPRDPDPWSPVTHRSGERGVEDAAPYERVCCLMPDACCPLPVARCPLPDPWRLVAHPPCALRSTFE